MTIRANSVRNLMMNSWVSQNLGLAKLDRCGNYMKLWQSTEDLWLSESFLPRVAKIISYFWLAYIWTTERYMIFGWTPFWLSQKGKRGHKGRYRKVKKNCFANFFSKHIVSSTVAQGGEEYMAGHVLEAQSSPGQQGEKLKRIQCAEGLSSSWHVLNWWTINEALSILIYDSYMTIQCIVFSLWIGGVIQKEHWNDSPVFQINNYLMNITFYLWFENQTTWWTSLSICESLLRWWFTSLGNAV